jgi:hypothetical protein
MRFFEIEVEEDLFLLVSWTVCGVSSGMATSKKPAGKTGAAKKRTTGSKTTAANRSSTRRKA